MRWIGFCFLLVVCLSCRKEERVNYASPFYYYSEDRTKVLYDAKEIDGISSYVRKGDYKVITTDVEHFSIVNRFYSKDAGAVYYKYTPVENVDVASFTFHYRLFLPMDKNHVYLPTPDPLTNTLQIIEDADPETYEKVSLFSDCLEWYRDKNYYFYRHKRTSADRGSLSFEAVYLPFDRQFIFPLENGEICPIRYFGRIEVLSDHLIRDSLYYYFNAGCDSITRKIGYAYPERFVYYDSKIDHIFRIDNSIYIRGLLFLVSLIDIESFEFIGESYSKDKNHVYYKDKLIPEADPETFEILSTRYAKDKNHIYEAGEILPGYTPETFRKDAWGRFPTDKEYGKAPRRSYRSWDDDDDD